MVSKKFHFLITDQIFYSLIEVKELNDYSFSGKINFIINKMDNLVFLFRFIDIDEYSNVEYLNSKKDIQLYLDEKMYRSLKYYHSKFNTYSIALILRLILSIFLMMVRKYGFAKTLKKIRKKYKCLLKMKNKYNKKIIMIQLLRYLDLNLDDNLKLELIFMKLLF